MSRYLSLSAWSVVCGLAFAVPMIALYLISIVIAWIVNPNAESRPGRVSRSVKLGLLIVASHLQWADADRKRRPRLVHPQR